MVADPATFNKQALKALASAGAHFVLAKRCILDHEHKRACKHKAAIADEWQDNPPKLSAVRDWLASGQYVGIVPASLHLVVVDFDATDSLKPSIVRKSLGEPLAKVPSSQPGRFHYYYRKPKGSIGNKRWLGGDIRCSKGYAILYDPGRVAELLPDITSARRADLDKLPPLSEPAKSKPTANGDDLIFIEGQRNNHLTSMAGAMRRQGASEPVILDALQSANQKQCRAPLDADEVESIAGSIGKYAPDVSVIPDQQDDPTPIDWEAFAATDHKVADWLAEPVLPRGKMTMIYSTGGAGKSLLGLELGAKVALGKAVIDRPDSEPLSVVYIDGEMTETDLADRLRSMDVDPVELVNLHYYLLQALPPLDTLEGGIALLEICRTHKADICIIDPLVYMIEGDENDSGPIKNMGRFTTQPLKRDGITLLLMDHSGKDKRQGPRGASAKQNIADVIWKLTAHGDGVRLSSKLPEGKRRQGWIPERIDLARTTGPLAHVHVENDSDDKIEQVIGELESLGVPVNCGNHKAGKLYREAGLHATQKLIAEAQQRRRNPEDVDYDEYYDELD